MRLGYLHIGPTWHGIVRYGRLLATEAQQRPELTVTAADVILTEDHSHNRQQLLQAARQLSTADVVHIQFSYVNNKALWGSDWKQLRYLQLFIRNCSCPLVATLHDLHRSPPSLKAALSKLKTRQPKLTPSLVGQKSTSSKISYPKTSLRQISDSPENASSSQKLAPTRLIRFMRSRLRPNVLALYWLLKQVRIIFVCSEEEAKRLKHISDTSQTTCVPHFIEQRSLSIESNQAKATLNLEEDKIVTLLGFIHPIKGHQLMIEALPKLPESVKVVFAGGAKSPGQKRFVEELVELAKAKGVDNRLRVTGYLSEQVLEHYLIATDLAVCPFQSMCASGSLSTWLSISRPILAYDLPQIAEYNKLEPGAIQIFKTYDANALAQAIEQVLFRNTKAQHLSGVHLRQRLSLPAIFDQHLINYRNSLSHAQ